MTVSASYDDEKQMVEVQVKDTGIGISPENIDRIFQPFDQEEGSGEQQAQMDCRFADGMQFRVRQDLSKH